MKKFTCFIILLLFSENIYSQTVNSIGTKYSKTNISRNYKDSFYNKLNQYKIKYIKNMKFQEVDSIKDAIPWMYLKTIPDNILYNIDSSEMIVIEIFPQKKENEKKRRMFIKDYKFDEQHLYNIKGIVKHNKISDFKPSDIIVYNKKQLKKINAEFGCEYLYKFNVPYQGKYNYCLFRHMRILYDVYINISHMFVKYEEKSSAKSLKISRSMFIFEKRDEE